MKLYRRFFVIVWFIVKVLRNFEWEVNLWILLLVSWDLGIDRSIVKNEKERGLKFVSSFLRIYFIFICIFIYIYVFFVVIRKKRVLCFYTFQLMANFVYVFYMHNTFVAMPRVLLHDTLNIYKFMYKIWMYKNLWNTHDMQKDRKYLKYGMHYRTLFQG